MTNSTNTEVIRYIQFDYLKAKGKNIHTFQNKEVITVNLETNLNLNSKDDVVYKIS